MESEKLIEDMAMNLSVKDPANYFLDKIKANRNLVYNDNPLLFQLKSSFDMLYAFAVHQNSHTGQVVRHLAKDYNDGHDAKKTKRVFLEHILLEYLALFNGKFWWNVLA